MPFQLSLIFPNHGVNFNRKLSFKEMYKDFYWKVLIIGRTVQSNEDISNARKLKISANTSLQTEKVIMLIENKNTVVTIS